MVTLGADIAAALPELRRAAESMMRDSCTITRPGVQTWDEATGVCVAADPVTAYSGPCRVRMAGAGGAKADAGETGWPVADLTVWLPIGDQSDTVRVGDLVSITTRPHDAGSSTDAYRVAGLHSQTHSTSRRLACTRVDR